MIENKNLKKLQFYLIINLYNIIMKRKMNCSFAKIILMILFTFYIEINSHNEIEELGNNFLVNKNNDVKQDNKGNII